MFISRIAAPPVAPPLAAAALALLAAGPVLAQSDELAPPVKITTTDGQPINVDVGHAAPFYGDLDGDGIAELLVGQFGEGKLRIYRNTGTTERPEFDPEFEWLQAGGGDAKVPFG